MADEIMQLVRDYGEERQWAEVPEDLARADALYNRIAAALSARDALARRLAHVCAEYARQAGTPDLQVLRDARAAGLLPTPANPNTGAEK